MGYPGHAKTGLVAGLSELILGLTAPSGGFILHKRNTCISYQLDHCELTELLPSSGLCPLPL